MYKLACISKSNRSLKSFTDIYRKVSRHRSQQITRALSQDGARENEQEPQENVESVYETNKTSKLKVPATLLVKKGRWWHLAGKNAVLSANSRKNFYTSTINRANNDHWGNRKPKPNPEDLYKSAMSQCMKIKQNRQRTLKAYGVVKWDPKPFTPLTQYETKVIADQKRDAIKISPSPPKHAIINQIVADKTSEKSPIKDTNKTTHETIKPKLLTEKLLIRIKSKRPRPSNPMEELVNKRPRYNEKKKVKIVYPKHLNHYKLSRSTKPYKIVSPSQDRKSYGETSYAVKQGIDTVECVPYDYKMSTMDKVSTKVDYILDNSSRQDQKKVSDAAINNLIKNHPLVKKPSKMAKMSIKQTYNAILMRNHSKTSHGNKKPTVQHFQDKNELQVVSEDIRYDATLQPDKEQKQFLSDSIEEPKILKHPVAVNEEQDSISMTVKHSKVFIVNKNEKFNVEEICLKSKEKYVHDESVPIDNNNRSHELVPDLPNKTENDALKQKPAADEVLKEENDEIKSKFKQNNSNNSSAATDNLNQYLLKLRQFREQSSPERSKIQSRSADATIQSERREESIESKKKEFKPLYQRLIEKNISKEQSRCQAVTKREMSDAKPQEMKQSEPDVRPLYQRMMDSKGKQNNQNSNTNSADHKLSKFQKNADLKFNQRSANLKSKTEINENVTNSNTSDIEQRAVSTSKLEDNTYPTSSETERPYSKYSLENYKPKAIGNDNRKARRQEYMDKILEKYSKNKNEIKEATSPIINYTQKKKVSFELVNKIDNLETKQYKNLLSNQPKSNKGNALKLGQLKDFNKSEISAAKETIVRENVSSISHKTKSTPNLNKTESSDQNKELSFAKSKKKDIKTSQEIKDTETKKYKYLLDATDDDMKMVSVNDESSNKFSKKKVFTTSNEEINKRSRNILSDSEETNENVGMSNKNPNKRNIKFITQYFESSEDHSNIVGKGRRKNLLNNKKVLIETLESFSKKKRNLGTQSPFKEKTRVEIDKAYTKFSNPQSSTAETNINMRKINDNIEYFDDKSVPFKRKNKNEVYQQLQKFTKKPKYELESTASGTSFDKMHFRKATKEESNNSAFKSKDLESDLEVSIIGKKVLPVKEIIVKTKIKTDKSNIKVQHEKRFELPKNENDKSAVNLNIYLTNEPNNQKVATKTPTRGGPMIRKEPPKPPQPIKDKNKKEDVPKTKPDITFPPPKGQGGIKININRNDRPKTASYIDDIRKACEVQINKYKAAVNDLLKSEKTCQELNNKLHHSKEPTRVTETHEAKSDHDIQDGQCKNKIKKPLVKKVQKIFPNRHNHKDSLVDFEEEKGDLRNGNKYQQLSQPRLTEELKQFGKRFRNPLEKESRDIYPQISYARLDNEIAKNNVTYNFEDIRRSRSYGSMRDFAKDLNSSNGTDKLVPEQSYSKVSIDGIRKEQLENFRNIDRIGERKVQSIHIKNLQKEIKERLQRKSEIKQYLTHEPLLRKSNLENEIMAKQIKVIKATEDTNKGLKTVGTGNSCNSAPQDLDVHAGSQKTYSKVNMEDIQTKQTLQRTLESKEKHNSNLGENLSFSSIEYVRKVQSIQLKNLKKEIEERQRLKTGHNLSNLERSKSIEKEEEKLKTRSSCSHVRTDDSRKKKSIMLKKPKNIEKQTRHSNNADINDVRKQQSIQLKNLKREIEERQRLKIDPKQNNPVHKPFLRRSDLKKEVLVELRTSTNSIEDTTNSKKIKNKDVKEEAIMEQQKQVLKSLKNPKDTELRKTDIKKNEDNMEASKILKPKEIDGKIKIPNTEDGSAKISNESIPQKASGSKPPTLEMNNTISSRKNVSLNMETVKNFSKTKFPIPSMTKISDEVIKNEILKLINDNLMRLQGVANSKHYSNLLSPIDNLLDDKSDNMPLQFLNSEESGGKIYETNQEHSNLLRPLYNQDTSQNNVKNNIGNKQPQSKSSDCLEAFSSSNKKNAKVITKAMLATLRNKSPQHNTSRCYKTSDETNKETIESPVTGIQNKASNRNVERADDSIKNNYTATNNDVVKAKIEEIYDEAPNKIKKFNKKLRKHLKNTVTKSNSNIKKCSNKNNVKPNFTINDQQTLITKHTRNRLTYKQQCCLQKPSINSDNIVFEKTLHAASIRENNEKPIEPIGEPAVGCNKLLLPQQTINEMAFASPNIESTTLNCNIKGKVESLPCSQPNILDKYKGLKITYITVQRPKQMQIDSDSENFLPAVVSQKKNKNGKTTENLIKDKERVISERYNFLKKLHDEFQALSKSGNTQIENFENKNITDDDIIEKLKGILSRKELEVEKKVCETPLNIHADKTPKNNTVILVKKLSEQEAYENKKDSNKDASPYKPEDEAK